MIISVKPVPPCVVAVGSKMNSLYPGNSILLNDGLSSLILCSDISWVPQKQHVRQPSLHCTKPFHAYSFSKVLELFCPCSSQIHYFLDIQFSWVPQKQHEKVKITQQHKNSVFLHNYEQRPNSLKHALLVHGPMTLSATNACKDREPCAWLQAPTHLPSKFLLSFLTF